MKHITTIVALILPFALFAQSISLDEYRRSVAAYSYTLKKAEANIDYRASLHQKQQTERLPSITLTGGFTQQLRHQSGVENWSFNLRPQLSQTIYGGGALKAESAKTEQAYRQSQFDADNVLLELCYSADYAFYNLMSMAAYCTVVDQYIAIVDSLRDVVELRYREGYISKSDLLMIETRLSEAEYEKISMDESYTIALQEFNILRGCATDESVALSPIDVMGVEPPQRASLEELLARRPDYQSSLLVAAQAQSTINVTRASYNPTLSVGVTGMWQSATPNIDGSTTTDGVLFLSLSAPLFGFGERRYALAAARSLSASSELDVGSKIDDIRLEESNMWASIIDSRARVAAAQRSLDIGSENLDISTYSYSEGLTTILDVMQAQISWLQLYTNAIASEFNYLLSISAYRRISAE